MDGSDVPQEWVRLAHEILALPLPEGSESDADETAYGDGGGQEAEGDDVPASVGTPFGMERSRRGRDDGGDEDFAEVLNEAGTRDRGERERARRSMVPPSQRWTLEQVLVVVAGLEPGSEDEPLERHLDRVARIEHALHMTVDAVRFAPMALRWVVTKWRRFDNCTRALADATLGFNALHFPFRWEDIRATLRDQAPDSLCAKWWLWFAGRIQPLLPYASVRVRRALGALGALTGAVPEPCPPSVVA